MAPTPEPTNLETATAPSDLEQVADLARRDAERIPKPYPVEHDEDRSVIVAKFRNDERLETVDLERFLDDPRRPRGAAVVHDPTHFVDLVNRLASTSMTTVWANVDEGKATAVINDHTDWATAGWRDHTVTLTLQPDEDWRRWMQRDGKLTGQAEFAEFLEDVAHTVIEPDAATMLEVATSMIAKRQVDFSQGTRLDSGDVRLRYEETTQAQAGTKGDLEVPERLVVRISPWRGVLPADLDARLRWRIRDGHLHIGYRLLRPDTFRDEVFDGLVARVAAGLSDGVPLYRGATPAPVR